MGFDVEALYALLPAIYRVRDVEHGEPLKALLSVIAEQMAVLQEDLAQLYEDQFIETCAEWVVPYIGDLIGVRALHGVAPKVRSQRAEVANTIRHRRRKGTEAMLEQLARDVTGWDARVVEFFQLLATTQYLNHLRLNHLSTPDLRQWEPLENLNTPFESIAHTADMRRIVTGRGRYNIPHIGVFLWRLRSYSLTNSPAFPLDERRYLFSPLGNNTPLFSLPQTEDVITHLAEPINVPEPVSRRVLHAYLDTYYGQGKSLLLTVKGETVEAKEIVVCDLSDAAGDTWAHMPQERIAVDPVLGRLALPEERTSAEVHVTFHYGFSADLGGGEYDRTASLDAQLQPVQQVPAPHTTIQSALDLVGVTGGVVEITDSGRYLETPILKVAGGQRVELRAADRRRPILCVEGDLEIHGEDEAEVTLNGLTISGGSLRVTGSLRCLRLRHCTLVPGLRLLNNGAPDQPAEPSLEIVESADATVEIDHCIVGGLRAIAGVTCQISNSIVDATSASGVAYAALDGEAAAGPLHVENSTIIGKVHTVFLQSASNTIFLAELAERDNWPAPIRAQRRQEGCVRFSYLPLTSQVPRRYRCRPETAEEAARLRPQFTSLRYGDPGYGQLSQRSAVEIRAGADDEAEMGAFHDLLQPQRERSLRVRLEEYLRFGLEAGIFYAT